MQKGFAKMKLNSIFAPAKADIAQFARARDL